MVNIKVWGGLGDLLPLGVGRLQHRIIIGWKVGVKAQLDDNINEELLLGRY